MPEEIDLKILGDLTNDAHDRYLKEKDPRTKAVRKREWRSIKSRYLYLTGLAKRRK